MLETPNADVNAYKFEQIRDMIITKIETGVYQTNHWIPPINTLCQTYGFSKVTVTRAFMHLRKRGYIFYEPGKGHYVL